MSQDFGKANTSDSGKANISGPKHVTNSHGVKFLGLKMKTPKKTRVTRSSAKVDSQNIITDVVPISIFPSNVTTKGTRIPVSKKKKTDKVSGFETPSASINIPPSHDVSVNPNVDSNMVVKRVETMTSLYVDPIKPLNVEPNVDLTVETLVKSNVKL